MAKSKGKRQRSFKQMRRGGRLNVVEIVTWPDSGDVVDATAAFKATAPRGPEAAGAAKPLDATVVAFPGAARAVTKCHPSSSMAPDVPHECRMKRRARGGDVARDDNGVERSGEYLDFPNEVRALRQLPPAECNTRCRALASQLLGEFGGRLTEWELGFCMSITLSSQLHPFSPKQINRLLCMRHEVPHRPLAAPPAA